MRIEEFERGLGDFEDLTAEPPDDALGRQEVIAGDAVLIGRESNADHGKPPLQCTKTPTMDQAASKLLTLSQSPRTHYHSSSSFSFGRPVNCEMFPRRSVSDHAQRRSLPLRICRDITWRLALARSSVLSAIPAAFACRRTSAAGTSPWARTRTSHSEATRTPASSIFRVPRAASSAVTSAGPSHSSAAAPAPDTTRNAMARGVGHGFDLRPVNTNL